MTAALAREIEALADVRVGDVLDASRVRSILQKGGRHLVEPDVVADLLVHTSRIVERRLTARNTSLIGLLDTKLVKSIESLLKERPAFSESLEDFIAGIMRQEFVQGLFTDVIYTSIVSFYQRLNPFFGRLATNALEEQIKGFIRLFMPMIQKEAIAFATNRRNQAALLGFTRAIVKQILDEPLTHYFAMLSARQRSQIGTLVRRSFEDDRLASLVGEITLTVWDGLYDRIQDRRIGELLRVGARATWMAEHIVEILLPILSRPAVFDLIGAEVIQVTHPPATRVASQLAKRRAARKRGPRTV